MPSLAAKLTQFLVLHTVGTSVVDDIGEAASPAELEQALAHHRRLDSPDPPASVTRGREVETLDVGAPLHVLQKDRRGVLLYLHGGAYVVGPAAQQWRLAAALADDADLDLAVLGYGLAPDATIDEAVAASQASLDLLAGRYESVAVFGDSAGGGLALATLQAQLRDEGALPALTLLFSPWVDAALEAPDLDEEVDILLSIDGLRGCARLFSGGLSLDDPLLSPLHGPLAGLPPIVSHVGTHELFLPDVRRLHEGLTSAGVRHELVEHPGMQHDFFLFPCPEARRVMASMGDRLRELDT